ncbi:hypothetical protein [Silvimonas sp.]|uniref:hypothetical protein n=1 Tax=Silvimonas sp. TaxID=2650811 RepID=UPI00283E8451|nr:hypothetical protein [Silvimonas sp.]MDR3428865.1 hypothetical protein [Silvimonas sp.]
MLKRLLLLLTCIVLLSACATRPQLSTTGIMVPPAGQAYAVLAITFTSFDRDTTNTSVVLQGPMGQKEYFAQVMTDFIRDAGDIPDTPGKLHLITLPPGHYTMPMAWGRWNDGSDTIMFSHHVDRIPLNLQFDVAAGEVIYLGDVHLDLNLRSSARLSDQHARDFNHIKTIWKVPDTSSIQIRLPQPIPGTATPAVQSAQ